MERVTLKYFFWRICVTITSTTLTNIVPLRAALAGESHPCDEKKCHFLAGLLGMAADVERIGWLLRRPLYTHSKEC